MILHLGLKFAFAEELPVRQRLGREEARKPGGEWEGG